MSEDLRQRILDAATELFATRGYGSTSVRTVVEAVSCTKPALYYHFGSKEELFREAVTTHLEEFTRIIERAAAREGSVADRLAWFIDQFIQRAKAHPLHMRLIITAQHPSDKKQPEIDIMSLHQHNGRRLEALLAEGVAKGELRRDVPTRDMAMALIGNVNMRTLATMYGAPCADSPSESILELFFRGAAAPGAQS